MQTVRTPSVPRRSASRYATSSRLVTCASQTVVSPAARKARAARSTAATDASSVVTVWKFGPCEPTSTATGRIRLIAASKHQPVNRPSSRTTPPPGGSGVVSSRPRSASANELTTTWCPETWYTPIGRSAAARSRSHRVSAASYFASSKPNAVTHAPGGAVARGARQGPHEVLDRGDARIAGVDGRQRLARREEMVVRIDQPRQHRPAADVDLPGVGEPVEQIRHRADGSMRVPR